MTKDIDNSVVVAIHRVLLAFVILALAGGFFQC